MARAEQQPYFVAAVNGAFGGALVPVPGGVLVKTRELWGKRPVRIDAREGQHNESVT